MRAVRIHAFGEPLRVDEVPEPEPGPGEVLVQVRYASVNPLDVWVTDGTVAGGSQPLPFVPGAEASGEVDGRPVVVRGAGLGVSRDGLYRERAAVPEAAVLPVPEGLDLAQATALPIAGTTAWRLVHDVGRVGTEDRVLVLGASGGVGSLVVQLARQRGATVWAQTTSPDKVGFLEELGVDRAVVAGPEDLARAAADLQPTVVVDPLAGPFTPAAVEALAPFGRLVLFGASAGPRAELDLRTLYRKAIQLLTYSGTIEPQGRNREALVQVLEAARKGEVRIPAVEVLPLEQAAEAHRRIRERRVRGKLLLAP
ncbi:MAG TPA: zinc-binding alcohol dehydrogenase family protein [Actinomycetota bacterium]|nr:zinc-binding alcohol dehydrogenase family protein [Actinomycetota bacterium]